jgi:NADP-dependent 3-hydroxy acid dehydrogenase YdfG
VIGAASGFGQGIAEHYAEEGAKVLICDINTESGEKVAASSEAFAFQAMNVSKAEDWQAAIDKAVQLWGKVDILVNNAGTSYKNKVTRAQDTPVCWWLTDSARARMMWRRPNLTRSWP